MNVKSFFALIITFAIATIYILLIQPYLFTAPVIPFTMPTKELDEWANVIFWPLTWILYGLGVTVTLIWIVSAARSQFVRAKDVLSTRIRWWSLALVFFVAGQGSFFALSFFNEWLDGSRSSEPLLWVPLFIIIDLGLLFWIPTAIATPRSLRYIPPLSMFLRKLYGG
jgi:hypothetical protein